MRKRKRLVRKLLSFLLTLAMVLGLLPGMSMTAQAALPDKVYYRVYDYSDSKLTYTDNEIAGTGVTEVTGETTEWADGTYVVSATTTISSRITVTGTVNLIIFDGATLTAEKGITVSDGNTLNIYMGNSSKSIQSTGQLNATALGDRDPQTRNFCYGAGIGGYCERSMEPGGTKNYEKSGCGNINIHGGSIRVQYVDGNDNVAGIGGSISGAGGNITIYYGSVTAYSYKYVSAIGAGYNGSGGNIAVYGGEVNAIVAEAKSNSKNGFGGTLTVGKDVQVYALQGSKTPNEDLSEQTNVAPEGGGQVTTFNNSMFTRYTGPAPTSAHTHNFTYTADGATITATCGADGCTLTGSKATLTIAPSSSGGYGASLSGDAAEFGVTDTDIEYSSDNGSTWSPTVPSTAGSYQARITVTDATDNTKTYTASVSYGVNTITTDKTYTADNDHGTVTVPEAAAANTTVTIKTTPAAAFQLESLTVTKAGGGTVSVTKDGNNGTFTMPAEDVTVSATFVGKDITVNLNDPTGGGSVCTAALLDSDYKKVTSLTAKAGGKFILSINKDEDYFYKVSLGSDTAVSMEEFSVEDYEKYIRNAESKNVSVSLDTYLFWVTMPGVDSDSVDMTVNFGKAKTFTILYRPTGNSNPGEVWVKFGKTENNEDKLVTAKMSKDAAMGDVAVWSLKMSAAFNPDKIVFATSESAAESAGTQTATVSDATFDWNDITDGQYLIVGNNAKTVIAAFTDDSSSAVVNREASVINIGDDAKYQIAICASGGEGTVTAPAAPTKEGYTFEGWRGYKGITATDYAANTSISVKENMVFSAVWQPKNPNVKLNLDGGTGIDNTKFTVTDNTTLASLTPVKSGFSFVGWSVAKDVTEDGKVYTKGAPFDTGTKITADLELTAQWKHVHAYKCIQIGAVSSLATKYEKYAPYLHIKICGCGDVDLEAHSLDSSGRCVCGYSKPAAPSTAELNVSYGQWLNGNYTEKMAEVPENFAVNSEVSVSAPGKWGSLKFSKWQYSTDNGESWDDASACSMMSFIIPGNMKMRALYVNDTQKPEVSMSATTYGTTASDGNLYDSILFRMNYKLPDGYTYVDAGVRSGDNAGISYYELKERTATMDAGAKAITYSLAAAMSILQGELTTFDTSGTEQYYAKRENSVLDENGMTVAKLGEYMYQSKPINIKDAPLYWNYKPTVKGMSGSINALTPVGFAKRNDGNHYIYAIAYLTYKDRSGTTHTTYTNALPTTLNGVSSAGVVSKQGE